MNSRNRWVLAVRVICLFAVHSTFAWGQYEPVDYRFPTNEEEAALPAPSSANSDAPLQDAGYSTSSRFASAFLPRWTASAEFIGFQRIGSTGWTLVERVPGPVPPTGPIGDTGVEALNANDLQQGFAGGPKLSLMRQSDSGYDVELSYFQIDGWNDSRTIGPDIPADSSKRRIIRPKRWPGLMRRNSITPK
jgi:hypothetical protein